VPQNAGNCNAFLVFLCLFCVYLYYSEIYIKEMI